jgi:predicted peptidase
MAIEPNYGLRLDRSHACAVPWTDGDAYAAKHWRCPECGRWWRRTWELAGDQPPVDYDLLLRRAGIAPGGETELKRQRIVHSERPGRLDYVLWIPDEAPEDRGWPMIVYLHGGDGGGHPSSPAGYGLPRQIEQGFTVPWVVVSPHCPNLPHPNRHSWSEYPDEVVAVVDEVRLRYPIDDTAILLTGVSMGGHGAWDLAARCPGRFSAVAPVSGGGDPLRAESLARLPLCVIHGARDTVVPVERSLEMIQAIRGHGGEVRAVIYSDADHGEASERAYAPGSELYDWFAAILAADR